MKRYCSATIDSLRFATASAALLAAAATVLLAAPGGARAAASGEPVPFVVSAGADPALPLRDTDPEVSGLSLFWRPGGGLNLKGEFRAAVPAMPLLDNRLCNGGATGFGCGQAWSPVDASVSPAWREASVGSEWEPLEGLRLGLDYYSREDATTRSGALLLPRVLDFIAPGWEDSLTRRAFDGEGVDLSVAYGFDAGLIGELELEVQFSQVLNRNFSQFRPLPDSAYGLVAKPESQASLGFNWTRGNFSGTVSSHYTDGVMLNGQVQPAAWTTVDINFAWRTPWNASLSLGAQNLLGQDRSDLGMDGATPPELDSAFSRVPYVRYEQDL